MQTTGIIIAGGMSSRMGTNKALLQIGNKTVIERIIEELNKIASEIIIVTNSFREFQFLGLPMIEDQWKGIGPLAGIHAGLNSSKTDKNLIVACDMPFVSSKLGEILLNQLDKHQAAVPEIAGQLHPLFSAYRKDTLEEVAQAIENKELKIRSLFKNINVHIMNENELKKHGFEYNEKYLFNMNNQDEFKKALILAADSVTE